MMKDLFKVRTFLTVGGVALLALGVLGYLGVIGPTPEKSLFGAAWWFDNGENLAHTVLGVAGLASLYVLSTKLQTYLVGLLGVLGVVVGLYSLVVSTSLLGANLENPADSLLHLVVGGWALWTYNKSSK